MTTPNTSIAAQQLNKEFTKARLIEEHLDTKLLVKRLSEECQALRKSAEGSNKRKFVPRVEENSFYTFCTLKKGIPIKTKQPDGTAKHMGEVTSRYVNDGQQTKHGRFTTTSTCKCGQINIIDKTFEMRVMFGKSKPGSYWVNGKFFVEDSSDTIITTKTTATGSELDFASSEDGTQTSLASPPEVRNDKDVAAAALTGTRSRTKTEGPPTTHLPYTITK